MSKLSMKPGIFPENKLVISNHLTIVLCDADGYPYKETSSLHSSRVRSSPVFLPNLGATGPNQSSSQGDYFKDRTGLRQTGLYQSMDRFTAKSPKKSTKRKAIASEEDKDELESDQSVSECRCTPKKKAGKCACRKSRSPEAELVDSEDKSHHRSGDDDGRSHGDSEESVNKNDLDARHRADLPDQVQTKKNSADDMLIIFSDCCDVKFTSLNDIVEVKRGCWCNVCRQDENFVAKHGKRKVFHLGSNSSCHQHIRSHYNLHKTECSKLGIHENHHTISREIINKQRETKNQKHVNQQCLDGMFDKAQMKNFSKKDVLCAVAEFVVCDDQDLRTDLQAANTGHISTTTDLCSLDEKSQKWTLHVQVIAFRGVAGVHSGGNIGRYIIGLCERVGIVLGQSTKLFCITADNASNDDATCNTIKQILHRQHIYSFNAMKHRLPCLAHVLNLAIVVFMSDITQVGSIETMVAIWEFDPTLPNNRLLGDSLDVIAAVQTLAIKIQSSGQCIKYFEMLQRKCGFEIPLKIPLQSNVHWGTADGMLS
ncbi:hypothetical protein EV702DRAFT_1041565 [Suillus placidus]|uniref:Uncharacterized protein n=1 Tax=Suillus placidus TaxID=48579 RepID=A0A9P7A7C0_9AGAM|nr:hypothetical protein EV702DRAFT_1041565 [Suillus placidus]